MNDRSISTTYEGALTDDQMIERVNMYLSELEKPKAESIFSRSDHDDYTSLARVASMLDTIESTNPILVKWKALQADRMNALAKQMGVL